MRISDWSSDVCSSDLVAMKYWQTDLRGATDNEVPTSTADPAFWQHMTTFTLGLGFAPLYVDQETPLQMDDVFNWAQGGDELGSFEWTQPAGSRGSEIGRAHV